MNRDCTIEDIEVAKCNKCGKIVLMVVTENNVISRGGCNCHDGTYEPIDIGGTVVVWDERCVN